MSSNRNIRYGLNLNRGLHFWGRLSPENVQTLGGFVFAAITDPKQAEKLGDQLTDLEGHIIGVRPDGGYRKLTKAPALGSLLLQGIDIIHGNLYQFNGRQEIGEDNFTVEGTGYLSLPQTDLFKKYQALISENSYRSKDEEYCGFELQRDGRITFNISLDIPIVAS